MRRRQSCDDGLAVVPYGSSDLELSALVAIVAPHLRLLAADEGECEEKSCN